MQSVQKHLRISTYHLHIRIYKLPPLEKDKKNKQTGRLRSSYILWEEQERSLITSDKILFKTETWPIF